MVSTKRKRKVVFDGRIYYWHIKKDKNDRPWIHIVCEDKSLYLKRGYDREISIGSSYIKEVLSSNLKKWIG